MPRSPSGASARPSPRVSIKSLELNALHTSQIQDMVHLNGNRSKAKKSKKAKRGAPARKKKGLKTATPAKKRPAAKKPAPKPAPAPIVPITPPPVQTPVSPTGSFGGKTEGQ